MIITIRSHLSSNTGYGILTEQIGMALEQLGHDVRLDDYSVIDCFGPISKWSESHRVKEGAGVVLQITMPNHVCPRGIPTAYFTMWESTRLLELNFSLPFLNDVSAVVVPCRWNAENFAAEGVTTPIHVVPLGLTGCYRAAPMTMNGPTRFGFAARVAHGPPRKRVREAVEAFTAAFPKGDEDVRLYLKIEPGWTTEIGPVDDDRICLMTKILTERELFAWYQRMTVLFHPSSGEGWGLHVHEAMACGRPVIACRYSGTAEFFNSSCGWEIAYDEVPATGIMYEGLGNWAMPRHDSMVDALREAHVDRMECARRGVAGAARAREFTWERSARTLLPVLESIA